MNETKPERGLASKGIEVYPNYTGPTAKRLNYATQIGDLTKGEREELDATCYDDDVEHSITGIRKKADAFEVTFLYNAKDVKVALITTIFGLIVALILQVFYNYVLAKIEALTSEMEDSSISLLDMVIKYDLKYKK